MLLRQPDQFENVRLLLVAMADDIQARIVAVERLREFARSMPQSASTVWQLSMLDDQMKFLHLEEKEAALSRKDPQACKPEPNPKKVVLSRNQIIEMTEEEKGETTAQWANSPAVADTVAAAAWRSWHLASSASRKPDPDSRVAGGSASEESWSSASGGTKQKSLQQMEKRQAKRAHQCEAKELVKTSEVRRSWRRRASK